MIDALLALPAHVRNRLSSALESRLLAPPYSEMAVRSTVGSAERGAILRVLGEWERMGVSPEAGVAWLRSLERAVERSPAPDFVWTGPEVEGLHARNTRRVYEELLSSAKRSIWASTYAFFDGPSAFAILARRIDSTPGLRVTLLLNINRGPGDTSTADSVVSRFADRFWNQEWPGQTRPSVYYAPRSVDIGGPGAVLHAKAVVADEESVFVTSANLTEAALDRNIEMGLLVRDRTVAATTLIHFRTLIEKNLLQPLPPA